MTVNPRYTPRKLPSEKSSTTFPLSSASSSRRNSMTLAQQFADIIRRFKDYSQHIQRLFKETDRSYNDIKDTRVLTTSKWAREKRNFVDACVILDKINEMQVSQSDREFLEGLETRSLTLILYSQTHLGKCRLINELLNDLWSLDTSVPQSLRTIRIKIEVCD